MRGVGRAAEVLVPALMGVAGLGPWVVAVDNGGQPWYLGPALFPRVLGLALVAGGVWCLAGGRAREREHGTGVGSALPALLLAVGFVAGAGLVGRIGLPLTAAGLTGLAGVLLGLTPRRAALVAVVVWVLGWGVFVRLLGVGR